MTVFKILKYPHVLLRKKSSPVETFTPDLESFTQSMIDTMYAFDGIGLAAPQVGVLKRVIVVDIKSYLENPQVKDWHGTAKVSVDGKEAKLSFPLALVNPEIVRSEGQIDFPFDGCLSFPGVSRGATARMKWIELAARGPKGEAINIQCDGIMSICLQHELDHLEGVLFVDRLEEKVAENEVIADIEDHESDPGVRRQLKKLHPVDARASKYAFL